MALRSVCTCAALSCAESTSSFTSAPSSLPTEFGVFAKKPCVNAVARVPTRRVVHDPVGTVTVLVTVCIVRLKENKSPATTPAPATLHSLSAPLWATDRVGPAASACAGTASPAVPSPTARRMSRSFVIAPVLWQTPRDHESGTIRTAGQWSSRFGANGPHRQLDRSRARVEIPAQARVLATRSARDDRRRRRRRPPALG